MFTRIVKLTFKSDKISEFEALFEKTRETIQRQEGCISLRLLQDLNSPNIFFTYSLWEEEKYLEQYRNSDFFKGVWSNTKLLFDAKAEAWSVQQKYCSEEQ